jgi:NADPH:quinone reductase
MLTKPAVRSPPTLRAFITSSAISAMRAFVCHALSDDLSGTGMVEVPVPIPAAGEVLVAVKAASVNFPDILMCQGKYQFKPDPPFIPGIDVAGTIIGLGDGVTGFAVGDEIVGGARLGGFAELACLPAAGLQPKPKNLTWAQAAAYPAAFLTAYVALVCRANLQAGETVLVHGAAGGVGLAACDLARHLGATVIATSASAAKRDSLRAMGYAHVLDATAGFREPVKALTGGRGADVIFDPVGGAVFDESVRCIAFDGRLLVIGFTSGTIPSLPINMALIKGFSLMGVRAGEYGRQFPERGRANLKAVHELVTSGAVTPHVGATSSLAQTRDALQTLVDRTIIGKAVILP